MKQKKIGLLISSILLGIPGTTSFAAISHSQNNVSPNLTLQEKSSEDMIRLDWNGLNVPEIPFVKKIKTLSDGSVELTFNTFVDPTSMYNSDTKETSKEGNSISTSNVISKTLSTDIVGVSYTIDTNPTTKPDNQVDPLFNNKLTIKPNSDKKTYLHIKVIDQAGNVSETTHIEFKDSNPPQLDLYLESEAWTDQLVTIFANAWDNEFESGIEKIKLPNGNFVMVQDNSYAINTSYLANNGTHEFTAYDKAGNSTTKSITVNNVDLNAPNLDVFSANENWTSEDVTLNISAWDHDRESGIEKIKLPNGNFVFEEQGVNRLTTEYVVQENGIYEFIAYDRAGNVTKKLHPVYWIDRVEPEIELGLNSYEYTNDSLTIQASTWDPTDTQKRSAGIQSLKLPDGTIVEVNDGEFTIDVAYPIHDNGVYTFVAYDKLGNTSTKSIQVTTIDKINPNLSVYPKNTNAATSVEIQIDAWDNDFGSGIDRIQLPSGNFISVQEGQYNLNVSYPVFENGNYTFTAYDKVGNKTSQTLNINHLDNKPPLLSITGNPSTWTNQNVLLTVKGNDLDSGVSHLILPDGTIVSSDTTSYIVNTNGSYTFTVVDRAGNQSSETVHVSKIDKQIQPVTDITHSISLIDKLPYQREIEFTFPAVLDLESGLKGYSYLIDNKPNSIPDDLVDSTTTSIKYVLTNNETHYLHIKAIDNAGNSSIVTHHPVLSIHLTTTPNPTQNFIRLDWTKVNESTYQVYQKKEGTDEFQTISMTDLTKNKQVQVLNVYPVYDGLTQQLIPLDSAFTTWDGEYINGLPQSARLKQWMEAPNTEHPKGYGQGFIKVTPVSLSEFNAYTEKYIKNSDGTWKYDVIMFGSWDGNGRSEDLTDQSKLIVEEFIQDGRGVLFGHDTIMHIIKNFSDLKTYTNMKTSVEDGIEAYFNYNYAISSNNALKLKPGLLTNFPWLIEKDSLDIPISHTNLQFYCGDTWYEFNASKPEIDSSISETFGHQVVEFDGCRNNSYLSTWNNTAMIQTGHSNGQATGDEQKILANTLFYLNQLSDANYLNDYSGQDVKGPETPSIKQTNALSNGSIELTFNSFVDQGSIYEYYVTATPKDGSSTITSNIASETITSGIAGISYVIDTNPDTEPDNQIDALSNNKLTVQPNHQKTTYLHVKVIDRAGNASETLHYSVSIPKINTAEQRDTHIYVNWDIEIPQNSIFFKTDFEDVRLDYGQAPSLEINASSNRNGKYYDPYGNIWPLTHPIRNSIKILPGLGINNSSGIRVNPTTNQLGWDYDWYSNLPSPNGSSDASSVDFSNWIKLIGGSNLIGRFDVKGSGSVATSISAGWWTGGSIEDNRFTWAETLTSSEFWDRLNRQIPIKINNRTGESEQNYHLATALDRTFTYNYLLAQGDIYKENGQWYYKCTAFAYPWKDSVRPEQIVTPDNERTVSSIQINQPLYVLENQEGSRNEFFFNSPNWKTHSFNLDVPDSEVIAALNYYYMVTQTFETSNYIQVDNLQIAYAPKSRLYRDGKLIYEDYSVEHTDGDVQDTVAPEKVIVSADYINGKLQLTWQAVQDKGTLYTYEVSGVDENGMESLRSEPKTVEFTSGVKEYRIYLNGALIETTPDLSYQFDQTITSSDRVEVGVVDHSGNESKTQLNLLNLTAQAKPSENMIRLDWTKVNESTYQVYQKKEGSDKFESIGRSLEPVKVLNAYPSNGNSVSFTTWDGENVTLSEGGLLKKWMEEPNAEHAKGYGQGLIKVTPVDFSSFNQNPSAYLKQTNDGKWNYDVVMVGSWDCNGDCANNNNTYFSSTANQLVNEYIQDGYGLLIGHDFRSFTNKVETEGIPAVEPVGSDLIKITKKGILSNFPWNLGEVGTILNIPYAHNAGRYVEPFNIWMQFEGNNDLNHCSFGNTIWCRPDKFWHTSTNNHYLSIKNNVAMIQTGHSSGKATSDEQKVLANTLFFLKQISEQNFLNDYSGQDVKGPETPSIKSTQSTPDGFVELTFNPFVDQGSTYEYYVKESPKNGSSNTISPIVSETITTGVAGVSYVIDTNPETEPDNQIDTLSNNKLTVQPNHEKTTYLHLKVIDRAGNASEMLHYSISIPKINTAEQRDDQIYVNWDIEVPESSIFWNEDFESKYLDLTTNNVQGVAITSNGTSFDHWGNPRPTDDLVRRSVRIIDGVGIDGTRGVIVTKTIPNNGWDYTYYGHEALPLTGTDISTFRHDGFQQLKVDRPAIARFSAKGDGYLSLSLSSEWTGNGVTNQYNLTWAENLPSSEFENALITSRPIKVNNPTGSPIYNLHLTTAFDYNNSFNFKLAVGDVIQENGSWVFISRAWYGSWADSIKPGQYVTPADQRTVESISIGQKVSQLQGSAMAENSLWMNSSNWTNYSMNLYIPNTPEINAVGNYFRLSTAYKSANNLYLDNLQIAYAPLSRLYRDGKLIYEDYSVEYNDSTAKDTTAPNTPIVTVDYYNENLRVQWKKVEDLGTKYTYEVSGVDENGMESLRSEPKTVNFVSGVKEYRIYLNGSIIHTTTDLTYTFNQELKDSDQIELGVIDYAGNETKVTIKQLKLTAEAKPSDNLIRLDWTDLNESTYQVYQKKEGATKFQSISMTDLSNVKQVQVLNIYPYRATDTAMTNITFNTWDGEHLTLPKSAALKMWMEQPVSGYPKGYGMGKIEVTAVSQPDFNQNPERYLKNTDGSWKYDVIVNGFWDVNAHNDYTQESIDLIRAFVKDGKGYLVGHDTLLSLTPYVGRLSNSLRDLVNIKFPQDLGLSGDSFGGNDYQNGTQVSIRKKGLLTNYPHEIGEIGTSLIIPKTHNSGQMAYGDIWLDFTHHTGSTDSNKKGNSNHYLTTWNNVAMIQTGHSTGEATPDEQKILANTLFYLNQLSVENYLEDHSGQDVKAPVKPSVNKTELLPNGFIELQFNELIDQGSTYEYYVKATHKSGYEQVSNTVKETITTGVTGVSYVIDTHPDTEPDHQVDAFDNNTLQIKPNPSQTTYLHIKVIDNAGNSSETLHYVLDLMTLTAQAKPAENEGKGLVRLDWTEKPDHTYQVYQKKEGANEFQSIGTTNFNTTKQVRVLNVYPLINVYDEPYITWDGEFVPSQHKSAVLKEWMEKPNAEDPKGYGKGLIKVHPITFDQFNQDPMSYLKDTNGKWTYDVIMFGSADSNMHADLNQESYLATKEFLDSGRGVLFGHDTLTQWFDMKYLPMLSSYANVVTYPFTGHTNDTTAPCDVWTMPWSGGTQVELVREGLFNTYPWKIGGVGEILTVPYTHTNSQVAKGDVWLKFTNPHPDYTYNVPIDPNEYSDNGVGTNMAYLTTWNNAAMIQTGHAINRLNATPDEQKIMANTLFYLNQLSSENWLDDYSGQDLKAPETPSIKNHTYRPDSLIELNFEAVQDNGSTYEYYVKATHKNGSAVALSNIASATVTTGVKGYSWIADSNPDTIPDEIIEQTSNQTIQIPTNNQGPYYLHIKAIDNAGNASETFHYELTDTTKPTFTLTPNPTDWTNQDVIITVDAADGGTIPSGIKEIILPDGNKVSGDTATFTAIENGTYTFEVVDFMGNRQTESITISNIDKIKPTGSIIIDQDQDEFYEEETELHLNMSDILDGQEKLSGIATVEIFDVNGTYSYTINNPTDYQPTIPWVLVPYELPDGSLKAQVGMTLTDKAGNTTTVYSKEVTIIKVRIDEFHLTDVINPRIYNSQNPFQRLSYPYIPSQELLVGGSFEFEAIYIYPPTTNSSWKATYEANIHYIHPTDGTKTIPLLLEKQSVDGRFSARHAIPLDAKIGTEVYLELRVAVYNSNGKLMGEDTFPDPAGTLLKIGEITGDIRELIQFNEIY